MQDNNKYITIEKVFTTKEYVNISDEFEWDCDGDGEFVELLKSDGKLEFNYYCYPYPLNIQFLLTLLSQNKEATHVSFEFNDDHSEYEIELLKINNSSIEEIEQYRERADLETKKSEEIAKLRKEIQEIEQQIIKIQKN